MERYPIPIRLVVTDPPSGVTMQVQKGRDDLLAPAEQNKDRLVFDLEMDLQIESGTPNFLGKFAQGPKQSRFIYINSGTYAGQHDTCWSRRAKVSLMDVTPDQVHELLASPGSRLEISIKGTGTDGGPVCASVKPHATSGWKVIK
jgi:hypothetical protein